MGDSLKQKDLSHYLHPMTALAAHERSGPTVFRSGKGAYVTDVDGHELLDDLEPSKHPLKTRI